MIGSASTMSAGVELAAELAPQVLVFELRPPYYVAVGACRGIREQNPRTHIIRLISFATRAELGAVALAGASAYVLKDLDPRVLIETIETVVWDESLLPAPMAAGMLQQARSHVAEIAASAGNPNVLNPGEEIRELVVAGRTDREIAKTLNAREFDVQQYIRAFCGDFPAESAARARSDNPGRV